MQVLAKHGVIWCIKLLVESVHTGNAHVQYDFLTFFFFFLRDFIFKKTLFEKLQYLKQEQDISRYFLTIVPFAEVEWSYRHIF